jgi:hypothetical protein
MLIFPKVGKLSQYYEYLPTTFTVLGQWYMISVSEKCFSFTHTPLAVGQPIVGSPCLLTDGTLGCSTYL